MPFGGALVMGVGSLLGGLFGGSASSKASKQYIGMLQQAQQFLQGQESQGLANYQPYMTSGAKAAGNLGEMLGTPGQGLLTPWTQQFTAPTAQQARQTPGYQFQLQQGLDALQNSAAGKGSLLSGRTVADMNNYAQGVASTNYQNVFNNALTQYQSAYQTFLNNQQNTYNMLSGQAGMGLNAASNSGNFVANMGGDIASLLGQQGSAQASGTMGAANAYSSILPGIGNAMMLPSAMSMMGMGGRGGNPSGYQQGPTLAQLLSLAGGMSGMPANP